MDSSGLGDSAAHLGMPENVTYSPHAVADVTAALDALHRKTGLERFVLGGLCAGAYLSFHTALAAHRIAGVMLINPVTFYFKPGMSLEVSSVRAFVQTEHYKRAFLRPETWAKALRGKINVRLFARSVGRRARDLADARLRALMRHLGRVPEADDLEGDLQRLAGKGVKGLFVFAQGEPGLDALQLQARRTFDRLRRKGQLQLQLMPGTDHTFTPVWSQHRLTDLLTRHLLEQHP